MYSNLLLGMQLTIAIKMCMKRFFQCKRYIMIITSNSAMGVKGCPLSDDKHFPAYIMETQLSSVSRDGRGRGDMARGPRGCNSCSSGEIISYQSIAQG